MDHNPQSNWRAMFERGRQDRPPDGSAIARPASPSPMHAAQSPASGYDDGHNPARQGTAPPSHRQVTDEAAMALADDMREYQPWVLQRGTRAVIMLHLRRFDVKIGRWTGWQMSYPHLVAVEYIGDLVSLDFGTRHFVLEGRGLNELVDHLQSGIVLRVQEYASSIWAAAPTSATVSRIRMLTQQDKETK